MGIEGMEIVVQLKKGLIFSIRTCSRSVHSHPVVVGIVFFFFLLYRFLPSVFGFLVSSSPVLVCTFVLLGTLLSYGNPNIPEVEEEEEVREEKEEDRKTHHEISSLKADVVEGDYVVEKDESVCVDTHVEKSSEMDHNVLDEKDLTFSGISDDGLVSTRSVVLEKEPEESHGQKHLIEEKREFYNPKFIEKKEFYDLEFAEKSIEVEPLIEGLSGFRNDGEVERVENDGETHSINFGEPFGSSHDQEHSAWEKIEDHDGSYDSGSDGEESSSPDASMTDIIPMLDELHPLLDEEHPQAAHVDDDSDGASERSHSSSDGNVDSGEEDVDSGEEGENHEEGEEEEEEDDEDEEQRGVREDEAKGAVTWTEDDEKNLMDLGNSELERNRRLESLIARRRARKSFRMLEAEKNLIDFDSGDMPFQIAPISTARRNPFDLHYDSNMAMGLPPIPGSAPSVLLPRRNPFDLPYDPHEERPNLSGDSFNDEFASVFEKDTYFRRHDSFNLGASLFAPERHDVRYRPFFVPEHTTSEGVGYSASRFQRQISEASESKASVSSVTETESVSTIANQDDHANLVEQESSQEVELISHADHTPGHVKLENQSSTEEGLYQTDIEDKKHSDISRSVNKDVKDGTHSSLHYSELITSPTGPNMSNVHMNPDVVEKPHTRSSSSSSLSEVHEKIFDVNIDDELTILGTPRGDRIEYSRSFMLPSVVESAPTTVVGEEVEDSHAKEPVYDLSPSATAKNLSEMVSFAEALSYMDKGNFTSTSSIASDMQVEVSEVGSISASMDENNSFTDGESMHNGSIKNDISSGDEKLHIASPEVFAVNENVSTSRGVTTIIEPEISEVAVDHPNELVAPMSPSVAEKVMSVSSSSSSDTESEDASSVSEEASLQSEQHQVPRSSVDADIHFRDHQSDVENKVNHMTSSHSEIEPSSDLTSFVSERQHPMLETEKATSQASSDVDCEQFQERSISPAIEMRMQKIDVAETEIEESSDLYPSFFVPASFASEIPEKNPDQIDFEDNWQDEAQTDSNMENLDVYQETIGSHISKEEYDEEAERHQEIDEGLLSELDAVGDFSFGELGASTDQRDNQLQAHGSLTGLQVLEAESDEDDSDKLHAYEAEDSQKPMESEYRSTGVGVEDRGSTSEVLEAKSTEIVDSTLNQHHGELLESMSVEPNDGHIEIEDSTPEPDMKGTGLEMPVLEARCLEDLDSTFEQLGEVETEKSVVQEQIHEESQQEVTEAGSAVIELPNQGQDPTETSLELPVIEARSLADIGSAFEKFEGEAENSAVLRPIHEESIVGESKIEYIVPEPSNQSEISSDTNLDLPAPEARSLENIDLAFKHHGEGEVEESVLEPIQGESILDQSKVGSTVIELPNQDQITTDTSLELPLVEARSLGDIDAAFKQLGEEGSKKHVIIEPIQGKLLVEEKEVLSTATELQVEHPTETSLDLPVIEARSVEDIDLAFRQLGEQEANESVVLEPVDDESLLKEPKVQSTVLELPNQDESPNETSLELPVVEARSIADIDLAFKQLGEREAEKPIVLEPVLYEAIVGEHEVESSVSELPKEEQNPTETSLELPILEARSLEDIDSAFKQLSRGEDEYVVLRPVHDESLLEQADAEELIQEGTEVGSSVLHYQDQNLTEPSSEELPISEAKTIQGTFKEHSEGEGDKSIVLEAAHEKETSSEQLPGIEVRFVEDIGSDTNHPSEGEGGKSVVQEPANDDSVLEDSEMMPVLISNQDPNIVGSSSELPVREVTNSTSDPLSEGAFERPIIHKAVEDQLELEETENQSSKPMEDANVGNEARSLEVLDSNLKRLPEGSDDEKPIHESVDSKPRLVDSQDSTDIHSDWQVVEEESAGATHSAAEQLSDSKPENVQPSESEETGTRNEESSHGDKEPHGNSSLSETGLEREKKEKNKEKKKKKGSHKSSSSSGSSSSSSDSD